MLSVSESADAQKLQNQYFTADGIFKTNSSAIQTGPLINFLFSRNLRAAAAEVRESGSLGPCNSRAGNKSLQCMVQIITPPHSCFFPLYQSPRLLKWAHTLLEADFSFFFSFFFGGGGA